MSEDLRRATEELLRRAEAARQASERLVREAEKLSDDVRKAKR
jgi:methyl-accepting chemotaxis protein